MEHFPYYEFAGDPYSLGHAHGRRLQASIRRQVDETLNASRILGMTRAQALRLKTLADEAYQPGQHATNLTFEEATRRIDALNAEIALADSF